jgi:uncharacterized protein (DUF427 family)
LQFYFPQKHLQAISSIKGASLKEGDKIHSDDGKHIATQYSISVPDKSTEQVLLFSDDLQGKAEPLRGLVKIEFNSIDQWFEEDAPIHVHPKDREPTLLHLLTSTTKLISFPAFKRIDILPSTRHVKISIDGHTLAETSTSMHLFETGLPRRFYLPLTSLDQTILRKSNTKTQCPYKGKAEYYDVHVGGKTYENLFWYYTRPTLESGKVEGLVCPYNESVDIELDGDKLERPGTHFSHKNVGKKPSII